MVSFLLGLLCVALWAVLFFVVRPATGMIHLALVAGVALLIRGIATWRRSPPAGP
jgi:tryptophan-rich sensory protein